MTQSVWALTAWPRIWISPGMLVGSDFGFSSMFVPQVEQSYTFPPFTPFLCGRSAGGEQDGSGGAMVAIETFL